MLAAAARETGGVPAQIHLAGAIVLARDGRMALTWGIDQPPPPCLVNPLHGTADTEIPADQAGRTPVLEDLYQVKRGRPVPVCGRCAELAAAARLKTFGGITSGGVPGQQLRDRVLRVSHLGKRLPYSDFPSVWRDQSFGAAGQDLPRKAREHLGGR